MKICRKKCTCNKKKCDGKGKVIFKTVAITVAILTFLPTVFIKRKEGFDAYGLLSHVGYRKSKDVNGKTRHDVIVTLVDLSRYKADSEKEVAEKNEDSISIEK